MLQHRIEKGLQSLIGLRLAAAGRAADLEWFHFGNLHTVPSYGGKTKLVGDYALHVQCAWRIRSAIEIIVASQDRYYPADGVQIADGQFAWDVPGANRCDQKIRQWLESYADTMPTVQQIIADDVGSLCLVFSTDLRLEIFPDSTDADEVAEHWRYFQPGTDQQHLVMRAGDLVIE